MRFTEISPRHWEHIEEFRLEFDLLDVAGAGYTFPSDAAGNVDESKLTPEARVNLARCRAGAENVGDGYVTDLSRDELVQAETRCPCGGAGYFARGCGVNVCQRCGRHEGLARCFCGWSASGGDGYRELVELGETIDAD